MNDSDEVSYRDFMFFGKVDQGKDYLCRGLGARVCFYSEISEEQLNSINQSGFAEGVDQKTIDSILLAKDLYNQAVSEQLNAWEFVLASAAIDLARKIQGLPHVHNYQTWELEIKRWVSDVPTCFTDENNEIIKDTIDYISRLIIRYRDGLDEDKILELAGKAKKMVEGVDFTGTINHTTLAAAALFYADSTEYSNRINRIITSPLIYTIATAATGTFGPYKKLLRNSVD